MSKETIQSPVDCMGETFLLIHGSWHGAWCWEKIEALLRQVGCRTVTPDLPGHGNDPGDIAKQTLESYVERITDALDQEDTPVILVGHSMGGIVTTMAAARRPEKVKKMVYLSAFLLMPGQSCHALDGSGARPFDLYSRSKDGKTWLWSEESVFQRYANACTPEDQRYILQRLCPESIQPLITKLEYDFAAWESIPRYYITCTEDRAFTPDFVGAMLERLPCKKVYSLNADHSAYFSASESLAETLHKIAQEA